MSLIRIERDPSPRTLAGFGAAWLLFFGLAGTLVTVRGGPPVVASALGLLALLVPAVGLWHRPFLRAVFVGMSYAAYPFGLVVSTVLLAAVYFLVLTPIGLLRRALGHDPLQRAFDRGAATYWTPRRPDDDPERPFRQF